MINPSVISVVHSPISLHLCARKRERHGEAILDKCVIILIVLSIYCSIAYSKNKLDVLGALARAVLFRPFKPLSDIGQGRVLSFDAVLNLFTSGARPLGSPIIALLV